LTIIVPRSTPKIARHSPQRSRNNPGDPSVPWKWFPQIVTKGVSF
jgi:hypothetical protein